MTHNCFLSVVISFLPHHDMVMLREAIEGAAQAAGADFSDYEVIVVDNRTNQDLGELSLPEATRNNTYLVRLASSAMWDNVVLAGLERANGDFAVTLDPEMKAVAVAFDDLYRIAQAGNDITYLRTIAPLEGGFRRRLFYWMLRTFGGLKVDPRAMGCYMLSRRAMNLLTTNWAPNSFLAGQIFSVGFVPAPIDVTDQALVQHRSNAQNHNTAWASLTRTAGFPLLLGQLPVLAMAVVSAMASINALVVRLFEVNIFGQPEAYVPGWTFIVLLTSFGFLITNIAIYAVLRFLYVLLGQFDRVPPYTVQKFGRLS